jgi:hypothetical protein
MNEDVMKTKQTKETMKEQGKRKEYLMVILFSMEHEKLYYLAMVCNED